MNNAESLLQNSAVWGCFLTLAAFAFGTLMNRLTGKAWCNPLLLSSLSIIVFLSVLRIPYQEYRDSASPISYLLLPATVSLAVPLYEQWETLRKNAVAILAGILAGVLTSLGSILLITVCFRLTDQQFATLLPKSVTTAIGMDVASELGGLTSLAGTVIVLTGIVGNLLAGSICRIFRITSPMAKGVAIGTSSHAIGTAKALEMGEVEGAMSGLAIAVSGVLTALLAPVVFMIR
ncbi:MAG: Holin-like protein CidB [Enterocloster aldenensis]